MWKTVNNYIILLFFLLRCWLDVLKCKLGFIKEKYGIHNYFQVKGVHLTTFISSEEVIDACETYDNFRPDDVFICTYPKSGTHFTGEIIASIYKEKGLISATFSKLKMVSMETRAPTFMKLSRADANSRTLNSEMAGIDADPSPRILSTHLPWDMLPPKVKAGKVKVIHCMRNPKDVVCSFFAFLHKTGLVLPGTQWNDFFMNFIAGNVTFGSYTSYLTQWYPNRNMASVLNLHFEEMKMDLEGNVRKIAEFLGIELTDDQVRRVTVANTFVNKAKVEGRGHIIYRTGKVGGWKSELTVQQNEIMDEWLEAEMVGMEDLKLTYE